MRLVCRGIVLQIKNTLTKFRYILSLIISCKVWSLRSNIPKAIFLFNLLSFSIVGWRRLRHQGVSLCLHYIHVNKGDIIGFLRKREWRRASRFFIEEGNIAAEIYRGMSRVNRRNILSKSFVRKWFYDNTTETLQEPHNGSAYNFKGTFSIIRTIVLI